MNGNGTTIPAAAEAVEYAEHLKSLGFSRSATGPGKLDGRPHVVDQPFGAGRAVMFGHNPFYRSWKGGDERLVLNALLYPRTAAVPPSARFVPVEKAEPLAEPLRTAQLPAVKANQLADWSTEPRFNPVLAAPVIRKLTEVVTGARTDITA